MPTKPCLDCGTLIRFQRGGRSASRCDECASRHQRERDQRRGSASQRGYGEGWRKVRAEVLERDGWQCQHCGQPANTVDHLVSLAEGGSRLDPNNLVACCSDCNSRRGGATRRPGGGGPT
jgi:5-methylcytosine-specific restriction endonuclease McrA